jgi:hypothetical protein
MARQCEHDLFSHAPSEESYLETATLEARLQV